MATKQKNAASLERRRQDILAAGIVTLIALAILGVYLMPLAFGVVTSLKTSAQASEPNAPILPMDILTIEYEVEGEIETLDMVAKCKEMN